MGRCHTPGLQVVSRVSNLVATLGQGGLKVADSNGLQTLSDAVLVEIRAVLDTLPPDQAKALWNHRGNREMLESLAARQLQGESINLAAYIKACTTPLPARARESSSRLPQSSRKKITI